MTYMESSGNATVDAMGQFAITGNITPVQWYKTIIRENGKPHLLAITILSDLVYWFRPTEVRDERSGQVIGWRKKFRGEKLQKSYKQYENMLGESRRTIKMAFDVLVELGVIYREFREVNITSNGMEIVDADNGKEVSTEKKLYNVMFLDLNVEKLNEITYPKKVESEDVQNNDGGGTKFCMRSDKILHEVMQKNEGGHTEKGMTYLQKNVPGDAKECRTNTENTAEIIIMENKSISKSNPIQADVNSDNDWDLDIDGIINSVNELIDYDLLHIDLEADYSASGEEFNGVLEDIRDILAYEVFAAPDGKRFNWGTREKPDYKYNGIIKNVFLKHLNFGIVKTYIAQYLNNSAKVKQATVYHIKSLYLQCLTQSSQYLSGGRSFFARQTE